MEILDIRERVTAVEFTDSIDNILYNCMLKNISLTFC